MWHGRNLLVTLASPVVEIRLLTISLSTISSHSKRAITAISVVSETSAVSLPDFYFIPAYDFSATIEVSERRSSLTACRPDILFKLSI